MAQVEKIKKLIREMMDQEMENYKDAVSLGTQDETSAPVVYTMLQVLLTKIEKMPNEPANEDLEKEVYEHLWKGRMGADVSKPIYFSYDELLAVARHFAAWQKQQMMKDSVLCGVDGWFINNKRNCRKNGRFYKYYESTITHDKPLPMENGKDYRLITIKED